MRLRLTFALMLLLIAAAVWIKESRTDIPERPILPQEKVILAFGDSLTYGIGADPTHTYPAQLEQRLNRRVINAGIPGELSEEGLKRLPALLDRYRPALVLLCHGGNDILQKKDRGTLHSNLEAMVRMARERNIGVILIAAPDFSLLHLSPLPLYAEVAERYHVPVETDILSDLLHDNGYKSDLVHPNGEGYGKMAQAIERVIRENYVLK